MVMSTVWGIYTRKLKLFLTQIKVRQLLAWKTYPLMCIYQQTQDQSMGYN